MLPSGCAATFSLWGMRTTHLPESPAPRQQHSTTATLAPALTLFASIIQDIENGAPLIPLRELSSASFVPRKSGRKPHPSRWFRWAGTGLRGVRLETICAPSLCTTKPAVLRFYARLTAGSGAPAMTSSATRRHNQKVDRELDLAGLA